MGQGSETRFAWFSGSWNTRGCALPPIDYAGNALSSPGPQTQALNGGKCRAVWLICA